MLSFMIYVFILFDLIIFKIDNLYCFIFRRWILWWNFIFFLNFNNFVIVIHYFLLFFFIWLIFLLIRFIFLSLVGDLYCIILFAWLVLDHFHKLILDLDGILITLNINVLIHFIDLLYGYFVEVRSASNIMICT